MGVFGSGRRSETRSAIEECQRIDVRDLHRRGFLSAPFRTYDWQWSRGDKPSGNIHIRVCPDRLELIYRYRSNGGPWQDVLEPILIVWTDCHYGGRRPWLECPKCGRRVAVIASDGQLFLCRHCYKLAYRSQQMVTIDRLMRRTDKLRARLGGEPYGGLSSSLVEKPKWMRWKAYERLADQLEEAETNMWSELTGIVDKQKPTQHSL